jgi:hypothetical protein
MKKFIPLLILFTFAGCTPVTTSIEEKIEPEETVVPIDKDLAVSEAKIEEEAEFYVIDVTYPVISGADKLNQEIEDNVQGSIDFFKIEVEENMPYFEEMEGEFGKSSLYVTYEIHTLNPKLASIQFGNSDYTAGAAHPAFYTSVLNYDIKENKEIEISDLFIEDSDYLTILSDSIIQKLSEQMLADFEYADTDWIESGAAPEEIDYAAFVFDADGLFFTFDPYIVGPYAIGPQNVTVPYDEIGEIINDYAKGLL